MYIFPPVYSRQYLVCFEYFIFLLQLTERQSINYTLSNGEIVTHIVCGKNCFFVLRKTNNKKLSSWSSSSSLLMCRSAWESQRVKREKGSRMAVAISGSSLISSTLQHYNNRIYIRDYPIPCHSSNPICNSFNFKRRSFSPSSPKFNDHVVNPSSSYLSSKLSPIRTHSSFAGKRLQI